jgi:NTE family protein
MEPRKIAIACQGGGTHAAFTCGVLTKILETQQQRATANGTPRFNIIGISGTSAGALCALMVWYGLAPKAGKPGSVGEAIERLNYLWDTFAAQTRAEVQHNSLSVLLLKAREKGLLLLPEHNPHGLSGIAADYALFLLGLLGARGSYLKFRDLLDDCCPQFADIDWPEVQVRCLAGAIEVLSGNHEVFDTDLHGDLHGAAASAVQPGWRQRRPFSLDGVMASGTLPHILPAQRIANLRFPYEQDANGSPKPRDGQYWDGLYSQNPPIREFLTEPGKAGKPQEIWVIRINPQERDHEPTQTEDIRDRENEVAGNVSLNQELDFILTVNRWAQKYEKDARGQPTAFALDHPHITVRTLKMRPATARKLRASSKFDRSPAYIDELRGEGGEVAEEWLANWPNAGDEYPQDAGYA